MNHRVERLQVFFSKLNNVFIFADQKVFLDIFRGTTTTYKIVWKRDIIELKYLMSKLKEWISFPKGYTLWQMVCARFQIMQKVKYEDKSSYEIVDLETKQFTSGGKLPTENEKLDKIIQILNPKIFLDAELDDNLVDKESEHSEILDREDALANGLNTDVHI